MWPNRMGLDPIFSKYQFGSRQKTRSRAIRGAHVRRPWFANFVLNYSHQVFLPIQMSSMPLDNSSGKLPPRLNDISCS